MSGRWLVSALPGEVRAARLDHAGRLTDLLIDRAGAGQAAGQEAGQGGGEGAYTPEAGDLVLGRVRKLDPGLGAAFVDIGAARPAFLPLHGQKARPAEGEALALRVARAASASKGAKVKPAPGAAVPSGLKPPAVLARAAAARLPGLAEGDTLVPENADAEAWLRTRLDLEPSLEVQRHRGPGPLFNDDLEAEIDGLLGPQVELPGGGRLWIEPVRALTAIDLDSASRWQPGAPQDLALEIDRVAVPEVARQIRLRGLSGLILVDFLELERKSDREALLAELRAALAEDPEPVQVVALRASGLAELTRRRARPPLHEVLCRRAGADGGGWAPTPLTEAFRLLRRLAASPAAPGLETRLAPQVAAALRGPAAEALAALERRRGHAVTLTQEPGRGLDESEILLK